MKNFEKIIRENKKDFINLEQLVEFIDNYSHGNEPDEIEEYINEQADSLTPIYYWEQVKKWTENADCHGLAGEEGLIEGEIDAYKIMSADLFAYIYQELSGDYQTFIDLLKDEDDEEPKI